MLIYCAERRINVLKVTFYGLKDSIAQEIIKAEVDKISYSKVSSISVSFNHDPSFKTPNEDFKVLLLWEPSAVMPWQYQARNLKTFDLVVPMSVWRASKLGIKQFAFHPYTHEFSSQISPFRKRERKVVMINSAKFSAGKSSLYGLRREISKHLRENNVDYSLYGTGWNMSHTMELRKRLVALKNSVKAKEAISIRELTSMFYYSYPEYVGWVENKFELLSRFELSLVIENEADWVTEKVFDSIVAGTVPVYVGPDLSKLFPKLNDCLLVADFNVESIYRRISELRESELDQKRIAIRTFIKDSTKDGIEFWSPQNQWKKIAKIISEALSRL